MNIDLAAFRLNALTALTSGSSASGKGAGTTDFLSALMNAQDSLAGLSGGSQGGGPLDSLLGGGERNRVDSVLAELEASNAAFLRRYNARVKSIGEEGDVLTQLRARVAELGGASQGLESLSAASSDADIKSGLKDFITRYNAWDSEFDPYFEDGALLDDNTAGEVARFSLKREIGSIFHGAGNGGFAKGLTDMGVTFTPDGQLQLDEAAFDAAMNNQRARAVQTLNNVASAFGDAAQLLASDGHLLDRRIDNAARAVDWAAGNQGKVDAEFGPGAVYARMGRSLG